MARKNAVALTIRDFEIADSRHVAKGLRKHFTVLKEVGVKEADIRDFEGVIAGAASHNKVPEIPAQVQLDQGRLDVRQRLGNYRRWSEVVARLPVGVDAPAAKALKVDIDFPNDDGLTATFMKGLDGAMKKYSARLAARSFGRDQQEGLLQSYAAFLKLQKEVVAQKSSRKEVSGERNSAFATLRSYTRHFRQIGLAAFYGQAAENDFRRLMKDRKPSKAAAEKAEARKSKKKEESDAKKAAAEAKKAAEKETGGSEAGNGEAAVEAAPAAPQASAEPKKA